MNNFTDLENPTLYTCGCCDDLPTVEERAKDRENRPGLPAIRYRLGRYGTFMDQLIARLTQEVIDNGPTLAALKTRRSDDGAIALLDAWSVVADVLTFYQERIANENYLRTATERRSVLELARAIGYELNPGVAASAHLAFTVATTPGSPERVQIHQGLQVLSIPDQGELPQTFETAQDFTAYPEWNSIRPRLTQPQNLAFTGSKLYLWTADADLAPLLTDAEPLSSSTLSFLGSPPSPPPAQVTALPITKIYLQGINQSLKVGQRILFVGAQSNKTRNTLIQSVQRVIKHPADNVTEIEFKGVPKRLPPLTVVYSLFAIPFFFPTLSANSTNSTAINTDAAQTVLSQPIREQSLQAFLMFNRWSSADFVAEAINLPPSTTELPTDQGVFIFKEQVSCFGHNAPRYETLPITTTTKGFYKEPWDDSPGRTVWETSQGDNYKGDSENHGLDLYLERAVSEIALDSWVLLENSNGIQQAFQVSASGETSLVDYGISGKSTGLALKTARASESTQSESFRVRRTTVYAKSERLALADLPVESALSEIDPTLGSESVGIQSLELETIVVGFQAGQPVMIQGKREDANNVTVSEVATVKEIVHEGSHTTLYFEERLQYRYVRESVTLYGNVVAATHGETVVEVLGSGDRTQPYQSFKLKKPPLTYTSASTPSGAASSLSVRVNNILSQESSAFYGLSAEAERYIVRIEDDGTTQVTFGDSQEGSRLPTGLENVIAVYRSGVGPEGEVPAGSLTLLKQRPLGVEQVTNLLAATGAQAPEQLANARRSAPLTVLTLDRIVSRRDYEDFAAAFAGIGKAQAVSIWDGYSEQVHITIAAANGDPVFGGSTPYENLIRAINNYRDPGAPFVLDSFVPRSFNVSAKLRVDSRYVSEEVLAQVKWVLLNAFAFENRAFGQGVSAAEVIALMQPVAGVIAVDLDALYATDDGAASQLTDPSTYLTAAIAQWNAITAAITRTELLLINPGGISLEVNPS